VEVTVEELGKGYEGEEGIKDEMEMRLSSSQR
jgi:hypothetical protein